MIGLVFMSTEHQVVGVMLVTTLKVECIFDNRQKELTLPI